VDREECTRYSRGQAEDLGRRSHPASLTLAGCTSLEIDIRQRLPVVVDHDKAGFQFLDRPRRWEPAFGHVALPCERVRELFAFVGQHTFGSIISNVEGKRMVAIRGKSPYPPLELHRGKI
jgi:hypothetical protein